MSGANETRKRHCAIFYPNFFCMLLEQQLFLKKKERHEKIILSRYTTHRVPRIYHE